MKTAGFFYQLLHSISCDITLHIISTKLHYMLVEKNEKGKKHLGAIPEKSLDLTHPLKGLVAPGSQAHLENTAL